MMRAVAIGAAVAAGIAAAVTCAWMYGPWQLGVVVTVVAVAGLGAAAMIYWFTRDRDARQRRWFVNLVALGGLGMLVWSTAGLAFGISNRADDTADVSWWVEYATASPWPLHALTMIVGLALVAYAGSFIVRARGSEPHGKQPPTGTPHVRIARLVRFSECTEEGDLVNDQVYEGVVFGEQSDGFRVELRCDMGVHATPEVLNDDLEWQHEVDRQDGVVRCRSGVIRPKAKPNRFLTGGHHDIRLRSFVSNAFALAREERRDARECLKLRTEDTEYISVRVSEPVDVLELYIMLPGPEYLRTVHAEVLRPDGVFDAKLAGELDVLKMPTAHFARLVVSEPSVGYSYYLTWTLPSAEAVGLPGDPSVEARSFRKALLSSNRLELNRAIEETARAVGDTLGSQTYAGLLTFDRKSKSLRHAAVYEKDECYNQFELLVGEGVAGRAFKLGSALIWSRDTARDEYLDYYKVNNDTAYSHTAMVAVPVVRSRDGSAIDLIELFSGSLATDDFDIVGVVTFTTYDEDQLSKIHAMSRDPAEHLDEFIDLTEVAWNFVWVTAFDIVGCKVRRQEWELDFLPEDDTN